MATNHLVQYVNVDMGDGKSQSALYCNRCKRTFMAAEGHPFDLDVPCDAPDEEQERQILCRGRL